MSTSADDRIVASDGRTYPKDRVAHREAIRAHMQAHPLDTNTVIAKVFSTSRDTVIAVRKTLGNEGALAALEETRTALVAATDVEDVKNIRDKAKGIQAWAKEAQDTAMFEQATRVLMQAERQAGRLLDAMPNTGLLDGRAESGEFRRLQAVTTETLADLGITKRQSARWRVLGRMEDAAFEEHVEATTKRVVRVAGQAEETAVRRAERIANILDICMGNESLEGLQRYPLLYVDPPWQYEHVKTESRAIENQYPTMTLDELKALPVQDVAYEDCVLFMWVTTPKAAEAMELLAAWGFTYRTSAVWDKQKIGMGYYFRQQHELLYVATRGNPPVPEPANRPASLFSYPRGAHSAKPVECYAMIEAMYPEFPKMEMFARGPRDGWGAWGNQSGADHEQV